MMVSRDVMRCLRTRLSGCAYVVVALQLLVATASAVMPCCTLRVEETRCEHGDMCPLHGRHGRTEADETGSQHAHHGTPGAHTEHQDHSEQHHATAPRSPASSDAIRHADSGPQCTACPQEDALLFSEIAELALVALPQSPLTVVERIRSESSRPLTFSVPPGLPPPEA
jgi:hypothetical protein